MGSKKSFERGGPGPSTKRAGFVTAAGAHLMPFEREFVRRVCHRGVPVEKAMEMLDTNSPGQRKMTVQELLKPRVLEAIINEFAVMSAGRAQYEAKWKDLAREAKSCLREIIRDKKATAAARVNGCKAIFDVLKVIGPEILKEHDLQRDLETSVDEILSGTSPVTVPSKSVN